MVHIGTNKFFKKLHTCLYERTLTIKYVAFNKLYKIV